MVCDCSWWRGLNRCLDEIPEGRVEAGHAPWNSFGHNRDLFCFHRDRAVGIAPLTGVPSGTGLAVMLGRHDLPLVALGIAVAIFALLPGSFYVRLPGLEREARKQVLTWFGRLCFLGGGAVLIYLGVALDPAGWQG